jgi:hypothetical protein
MQTIIEWMETLGDALPKEQARVRELIRRYRDPILGGCGELAARMMEVALQEADQAIMSGDIARMIQAHKELMGFTE